MLQFAHACKTISSALVPCPLSLLSYPVSLPLKDHPRMSGAMWRVKIASSCTLFPRTRVTSASAPPSPIASSAVMKSPTTPKGTAPYGSTAVGASMSITPTMTVPSPIFNAPKTCASFRSGTQWWATIAQLPSKMTCTSCDALWLTMKMKSNMISHVVVTGIGGA